MVGESLEEHSRQRENSAEALGVLKPQNEGQNSRGTESQRQSSTACGWTTGHGPDHHNLQAVGRSLDVWVLVGFCSYLLCWS